VWLPSALRLSATPSVVVVGSQAKLPPTPREIGAGSGRPGTIALCR
jgi:hypothetical protein